MVAEIILLVSFLAIAWSYLLYPLIAFIAAGRKKEKSAPVSDDELPAVSILMPVYNEEKVIEEKIEKLLASEYPAAKIEILIGSDASDDQTDSIINRYSSQNSRIKFFRSDSRSGKASILNRLASEAKGDIIMITDANVMPCAVTVRVLASQFVFFPETGLCDTNVKTVSSEKEGLAYHENLYSRFESALKRAEGRAWGTMTGPYGGFYAVRKELFPVLPDNFLCDDLFVGLTVLRTGFRSANATEAIVTEDTEGDILDQYKRRVRIATGSFQNLFYFGLFPGKSAMASVSYFSHKVLRWLSPIFLILIFMTTVILSGHSLFYFCLLVAQLFLLLLPAFDLMLDLLKINLPMLRFSTQFLIMNVALAVGLIKALRGVEEGTWKPTKRY